MKNIIYQITFVALFAFAVFGTFFSTANAEIPKATQGNAAPDFSLTNVNGDVVKLADYAGKTVVLEWTNPDCPFVKRLYKTNTMQKLADKYKDNGVVWIAVSSTSFHDDAKLKDWATEQKITYPLVNDKNGIVGKLYGAQTTPHMFIIDTKGKLAYNGAIDNDSTGGSEMPINYVDQALGELTTNKDISTATTKPYGCSVKYG